MATIKKVFQPIMSLLAASMALSVEDIYAKVEELACAKSSGGGGVSSFHKVDDEVIALRCGYYKLWFFPGDQPFGTKASSASGYNTMCKEGMNNWTKQLATLRKGKEQLLEDAGNGIIAPGDIAAKTAELEEARDTVIPTEVPGFETLEELLAAAVED